MDDASSPKIRKRSKPLKSMSPEERKEYIREAKIRHKAKLANRRAERKARIERHVKNPETDAPLLEPYRQDQVRNQINVANILTRLQKCADGKLRMTKEQIACARVLLAKTLPDLQRVEVTGRNGQPIEYRDVNTLSDQDLLSIAQRSGERDPAQTPGSGQPH